MPFAAWSLPQPPSTSRFLHVKTLCHSWLPPPSPSSPWQPLPHALLDDWARFFVTCIPRMMPNAQVHRQHRGSAASSSARFKAAPPSHAYRSTRACAARVPGGKTALLCLMCTSFPDTSPAIPRAAGAADVAAAPCSGLSRDFAFSEVVVPVFRGGSKPGALAFTLRSLCKRSQTCALLSAQLCSDARVK